MHLYSNWALILRTGTRILQDTNYRATLFLLTELLYSKILHIGSESSPLVLPFHYCYIQLCERPYWYRLECPFPLHGKKKKKPLPPRFTSCNIQDSPQAFQGLLCLLITLFQLSLPQLSQFNISDMPTKNSCPS